MRSKVFRTLGAILGLSFVLVAIPIAQYSSTGFWPPWIHTLTFLGIGAYMLHYAVTGRSTIYRRRNSDDK